MSLRGLTGRPLSRMNEGTCDVQEGATFSGILLAWLSSRARYREIDRYALGRILR